ncbi:hypothetical protein WDU94_009754 [Cyamophila willieti]
MEEEGEEEEGGEEEEEEEEKGGGGEEEEEGEGEIEEKREGMLFREEIIGERSHNWIQDGGMPNIQKALFFIGFVIPCTIIVLCYAKIFWVVRSSEKRLQRHNSKVQTKKEIKAKRNDMRITKMVLVIFLSFITCYFPITVVKLVDQGVRYPLLHVLSYIFLYLSACINPIIYVIMNKQYRVAYKTVLMCEKSKIFNSIRRTVTQSKDVKKSPDRDCDQVDNKTVFSTVPCNIPMDNLDLSDAVFQEDIDPKKNPENNQRIS